MLLFCLPYNADSHSSQNNKNGLYYFVVSESNSIGVWFLYNFFCQKRRTRQFFISFYNSKTKLFIFTNLNLF